MGQIIQFPASLNAYPASSAELDDAEGVMLLGLRWWVDDVRRQQDPVPRLREGMRLAGAVEAARSLDALMTIASRTARRQLEIHAPTCDCLSPDETYLLHAASLAQAGNALGAESTLRTALLTAQGADMALGPLQGIGRLFSVARLLFRRRMPPDAPVAEKATKGRPAASLATLH